MAPPLSIRELLAETLAGPGADPLDWDGVARHIREKCLAPQAEKDRRARHERRQQLYQDGGLSHMTQLIDAVFRDYGTAEKRKAWAPYARTNNVIKRLVKELSTAYQEAAKRTVAGEANQLLFDEIQRLARRKRRDRWFCRMLNLHRAVLLGFRVRNLGTLGTPRLDVAIDVVTPDQCFLVVSPRDHSRIVAVGIRCHTSYPSGGPSAVPYWSVWSEREHWYMNQDGHNVTWSIESTDLEHGIGRIPYTFVSLDEPQGNSPWPGESGEDMVAAHMAIWFAMVSMLKETKSATKHTVLTGDTAAAARGQELDTEAIGELPEGTGMQTTDMSMDLGMFINVSNHVGEQVANNHGLSAALIHHSDAPSAAARDLMRVPLREQRLEQEEPLRDAEVDFVDCQAAVLRRDWVEMAFSTEGFSVVFGDPQTPRSVKEQLEEFEHARRLTLDSTIAFVARQNPDLTLDQVQAVVERFIDDETWRNDLLRQMTDSAGTAGAEPPVLPGAPDQPPNDGREVLQ